MPRHPKTPLFGLSRRVWTSSLKREDPRSPWYQLLLDLPRYGFR